MAAHLQRQLDLGVRVQQERPVLVVQAAAVVVVPMVTGPMVAMARQVRLRLKTVPMLR
jgi:hypothetical protein